DVESGGRAVLDNIARRARSALDAIPRATTAPQADAARPRLRRQLTDSLGYKRLPWPPDLQARITGTVRRESYHIEKVVFQSLPGDLVPAHLYVPDHIVGTAPAVLFYNGHWFADSKTKLDFQSFCINMARLGFVVLNYDPFGQGERGISSRDHRRTEGLLVGVAQQGYAEYDTQCALRYLLSRPKVDPKRIGMTGASGGGFDTWMTAALDDRIAVAVPVVATTDLYKQMMAHLGHDWDPFDTCHYVPGMFRFANYHELLAMVAPKPLLFINSTEDTGVPVAGA